MNKYFVLIVAIILFLAIDCSLFGQPSSGAGGGFGGGQVGLEGMGGSMMGSGMGRGMRIEKRPTKEERLASVKELEKQVAALKEAIEKSPEKDPNIAKLEGSNLTKFMDVYAPESDAINNIQKTLSSLGSASASGRAGTSLTSAVISELLTLAKQEEAAKLTLRLEVLAKEAEASSNRGGGMMGGRRGTSYTIPEGGFKYND